jgi:hypothetical protein
MGLVRVAVFCLGLLFVVATPAWPQGTFTTIDVLGAGTSVLQGSFPTSINAAGEIAGIYVVAGNVAHGFMRTADGTITKFDAPGAGASSTQGTFPFSIDAAGDIVGLYSDGSNRYHGFMRAADGTITTFDASGAGTSWHMGTTFAGINAVGTIAGLYRDASAVYHGFVRSADGTVTSFEAPGAGAGTYAGTEPISINAAGDITGMYVVSYVLHAAVYHGFVRAADGTMTTFDPPGAGAGTGHYRGTFPISINTAGDIAGTYTDASGGHGFVRAADGTITPFDAPGASAAGSSVLPATGAFSINDSGEITGFYVDASGVLHGFLRAPNGAISSFDAPGAGTAGTSLFPGTAGFGINDSGYITGTYADASGVFHGFVLTPGPPASTTGVFPASLTFGSLDVGIKSTSRPVTLRNTGSAPLTITSIVASANFGETNNCGGSVAAGSSCTISVTFSPTASGPLTGALTLTDSNGVNSSQQTVSLAGTGISPGPSQLVCGPSLLSFPSTLQSTASAAATVTCTETQGARVTVYRVTTNSPNYGLTDGTTCTSSSSQLGPDGQCTISVIFTPLTTGTETSTMYIYDSANNSPQKVKLTGSGTSVPPGYAVCPRGGYGPGGIYNPSVASCENGVVVPFGYNYCPRGANGPGNIYNPSKVYCDGGAIVPLGGDAYCPSGRNGSGGIYDPTKAYCDFGVTVPFGYDYCPRGSYGAGAIYDPTTSYCEGGVIVPDGDRYCPSGRNGPGGIYDPTTAYCNGGKIALF